MFARYGQILCQIYADHANPPKVLRAYLAGQTDGTLSYQGLEFSEDSFRENCFHMASFDILLDRAAQHIPVIWQALVCGKSVALYSPDITVLQACAVPILSLVLPGTRPLLPLVFENSSVQVDAAESVRGAIWCSCDAAVLNGRFDLAIDLSARNLRYSQTFGKEAGRSNLLESLANALAAATSSDGSVVEVMLQFNTQILEKLREIRARLGDLSLQSLTSIHLPPDTQLILSAVASSGVFDI
jgi:hypothetical protein